MENLSRKVRSFDAFPKVAPEASVRSQRGGLSTVLTILCMLMIIWVQIGGFLGGYIDRRFSVDKQVRSQLDINVDVVVATPCQHLTTNVMDITSDMYMAREVLNFQGVEFVVPAQFKVNSENNEHETPDLDEIMTETLRAEYSVRGARINEDAPACHIFGTIPVNYVKGELLITARASYFGSSISASSYNFSHIIYEYSHGDFFPYINNPLDFTAKVTPVNSQQYRYFVKIVPTIYEKLGVLVDTYQYSLTELHHGSSADGLQPSGISFAYSFEPISLTIKEKRLSFIAFVARLATILSGLLVAAGYVFRLYEKLLRVLFGKKYTDRHTEKKEGGLLDRAVPASKES